MIKQLRLKFICITMVIVTVLMCVIFGLVIHFTGETLEAESLQQMKDAASASFQPGMPGGKGTAFSGFIIQITPHDLKVLHSGSFDLSDETLLEKIVQIVTDSEQTTGELEAYNLRYYRSTDGPAGAGGTVVFADISGEKAAMRSLTYNCIIIGILALVAFFAASVLLAGWMTKPVSKAWEEQRQFVADASHELKTPLTVIMTNAEMLQNPEYDPDQQAQFSQSILTMSQHMRTLVEGLLELARVDNGSARASFTQLDLSLLAEDALLPFEPVFFEQGLMLESRIESGIRVNGSASHLRQALTILLDNAMKYSSPGGTVILTLKKQGGHALLTVENPGTPIPKEDLENIFKRFYRVDKARSRDGSYGLGLAIAQGITAMHCGRIWASSAEASNTFHVQLPLA